MYFLLIIPRLSPQNIKTVGKSPACFLSFSKTRFKEIRKLPRRQLFLSKCLSSKPAKKFHSCCCFNVNVKVSAKAPAYLTATWFETGSAHIPFKALSNSLQPL